MEGRRSDANSPGDSSSSTERQPPPLTRASPFVRFGGVGIVLLCVALAFLYLGGWFNRNKFTPPRFADGFERVDGIIPVFASITPRAFASAALLRATARARVFQKR